MHQALTGIWSILGLTASARRYVISGFYVSDITHLLLTAGYHVSALINTFGMAYNRQAFGIFFQPYWHGVSALFIALLNLPSFNVRKGAITGLENGNMTMSDATLDWLCVASAVGGVIVFISSMIVRVREENLRRDGGPFDYIGEYVGAY